MRLSWRTPGESLRLPVEKPGHLVFDASDQGVDDEGMLSFELFCFTIRLITSAQCRVTKVSQLSPIRYSYQSYQGVQMCGALGVLSPGRWKIAN